MRAHLTSDESITEYMFGPCLQMVGISTDGTYQRISLAGAKDGPTPELVRQTRLAERARPTSMAQTTRKRGRQGWFSLAQYYYLIVLVLNLSVTTGLIAHTTVQ